MTTTDLDSIRQRYRQFADAECRGYSDAYHRLALAVADDDEVVRFIAERPETQPNLFFAAIQYLTGASSMPSTGAEVREVLARHGSAIAELMRARRTQTNEVGRCATLVPALPPGPLALVEVGASAGLCLLLDRYFYEYGSSQVGDPTSPVRLRCEVSAGTPVPGALPEVVWRRGLDLQPVDVRDPDACRWLLACVWPDHPDRRQRLEAAIAVARAHPPLVERGDLVDALPALLAQAPAEATLVVFHSAVLLYVSPVRREEFVGVLARTSKRREVVWISNEGPGVIARFASRAADMTELSYALGRTTFRDGEASDEYLGSAHAHGRRLTWVEGG